MAMDLIMKLGKVVAGLIIAAAIIAFATWGIALAFGLSDTFVGNFLGPLNPVTVENIEAMDAGDGFGDMDVTNGWDATTGFD
jgi:hypothetical protein